MKNNGSGGARSGAGRPKGITRPSKPITLYPETWEWLDRRAESSRGITIELALEALKEKEENRMNYITRKWLKFYPSQTQADVRIVRLNKAWSHDIGYAHDRVTGRVCEIGYNSQLVPVTARNDQDIIDRVHAETAEYDLTGHGYERVES